MGPPRHPKLNILMGGKSISPVASGGAKCSGGTPHSRGSAATKTPHSSEGAKESSSPIVVGMLAQTGARTPHRKSSANPQGAKRPLSLAVPQPSGRLPFPKVKGSQ